MSHGVFSLYILQLHQNIHNKESCEKYMIEMKHISSGYGKKEILKDITLKVERGQCVGIFGPNGSGKSTLLKLLAGVKKIDSGELYYYGKDARKNKKVFAKMVGYAPQEDMLIQELTVYDNLRLWYPKKRQLEEALKEGFLSLLNIDDLLKKEVKTLSGGMKKRVNIATALANTPPVLLLDEPGAALDLWAKEELKGYIREYISRKGTVIISTHDESELELCDQIYILVNGKLEQIEKGLNKKELLEVYESRRETNE